MKKWTVFVIVFIVIVLFIVQAISVNCVPVMKTIATKEIEQFCQLVVNHTAFTHENVSDNIITVQRDDNNQISMIDFDMAYISKIAGELVLNIEQLLLELEEGEYRSTDDSIYSRKLQQISDNQGVIAKVSIGMLTNNPFLASVGPKLKIKYKTLSHVSSSIKKEVTSYGINRSMIAINIVVTIKLMVLAPFYEEEYSQDVSFPLALEIIEGEVPQWYQN